MVPVGTGHVGCCVAVADGATGLAGIAFIVSGAAEAIHKVLVSCTVIIFTLLGANPAKTSVD